MLNLPHFSTLQPAQIEQNISNMLDRHRQKLAELLAQPQPYTWENLLQPIEDMHDELNKTWSPFTHLHSVMENEELRAVYNRVLPMITAYQTEVSQNETLYQAIDAIREDIAFSKLTPAQQKIIDNDLRDFKLAGVHLPKETKTKLAELEIQMSELTTRFSEHLLDATHAFTLQVTDEKELDGLPQQAIQLAIENAQRKEMSGYVFTLDFPSYSTAIRFLKNRELRKKLYEAYTTRASDQGPYASKWDNTQIMEDILKVRYEIARLVGYNNYAEYSLATKMAKTPDDVLRFLQDLLSRSKNIAINEYNEIKSLAKLTDGITDLCAWDIPYYSEKLQESTFNFTQEELRPYFPIDQVLSGLFTLVNRLYGITIKEEKNTDVWHQDVRFFSIYDDQQQLRSGFYIDLYARPHKRDGAWMDDCVTRRKLQDHIQHPVAYLTCNFMPPVNNQPALLTHDDVITLFHEFGHCLHHMMTTVDYASVAGVHGVPWDAIEFPSQFMENFCWEKDVLQLIAKHYQTGAALPDELYQNMVAAKHFQTGLQMVRQLEFALFDFRLHCFYDAEKKLQVQAMLDQVRKETAIAVIPEFNRFQHSFSHIFAGGYAAGYYSYKWAEVLSADAYAQFEEEGIFNPATGRSFLHSILEIGGVRDPMESFATFRGREPSIDALLRHSGITSGSMA